MAKNRWHNLSPADRKKAKQLTGDLYRNVGALGRDARTIQRATAVGGHAAATLLLERGTRPQTLRAALTGVFESDSGLQVAGALLDLVLPGNLSAAAFDLTCAAWASAALLDPEQRTELSGLMPAIARLEATDLAVLDELEQQRDAAAPHADARDTNLEHLARAGLVAGGAPTPIGKAFRLALARVREQ